jgi:hypothetical protein
MHLNKKILIVSFSIFASTLLADDTCYTVQLLSSYAPLKKQHFPNNAKVMQIGKIYTARYGCYERIKEARLELKKLKKDYPKAMISSSYKWRFKDKKRLNEHIVEVKQQKKPAIDILDMLGLENKKNTSEKENLSPTSQSTKVLVPENGAKCYGVQLYLGKQEPQMEKFPIGTKLLQRGKLLSAVHGCYESVDAATKDLYKQRKTVPSAIMITLPKNQFKNKQELPEIRRRDLVVKEPTRKVSFMQDKGNNHQNTLPLFYTKQRKEKVVENKVPKCDEYIENNIVMCKNGCKADTHSRAWEGIDIDAVRQYVATHLDSRMQIDSIEPAEEFIFNKDDNTTFLPEGILKYYVTATLNYKRGQLDNNGKRLGDKSLNLAAGLIYRYDFDPLWYFYTDDRLLFSMTKSDSKLQLDVKDLYIRSNGLFDNRANFLLGRKYLKDDRGWYYKTSLDMIGMSNKNDLLLYEIYAGTRLNKNTMAYDPNEVATNLKGVKFLIGHVSYEFMKDNTVEGFYVYEDNKNASKKLNWTGIRVQGDVPQSNNNMLSYWGDVATMSGTYLQQPEQGIGTDFGAKYYFTQHYSAVAASLAYGSGGSNLYMQPSFTNNRSNYLSKDVSFRYYGEFLQPELSNMYISSLYFLHNFEKNQNKTGIIALHNYTQERASSSNYNATNKTVNPSGKTTDIGNEIDLVLHYDLFENSYWRFSTGYFIGGKAFDKKVKQKDGWNAQVYYKYLW